jgi:HSP20 family protein
MLPTMIRRNARPFWDAALDLWPELADRAAEAACCESDTAARQTNYPVDIHEDDEHIYVDAEMPGFSKEQIDVTLDAGVLSISGQRDELPQREGTTHLQQRRSTRVHRRFSMPDSLDQQKVKATLEHGVLHLELTKRQEAQARKIEVH